MILALLSACRHETTTTDDADDRVATTDSGTAPIEVDTTTTEDNGALAAVSWAVHPEFGSVIVVSFEQLVGGQVHVEFSFDDGVWVSSPIRELDPGVHEELLLGVPYRTAVTFRVVVDAGDGPVVSRERVAATGPVPDTLVLPTSATGDGWDASVPWVLLSLTSEGGDFGDPWWTYLVDRRGRVVWARRSERGHMSMHPRLAWDQKSVLIDQNTFWASFDHGQGSTITQLTLDGAVQHVFPAPGLHHPFAPMPDGSLVYGAITTNGRNERLTRVDPVTDARTVLFDCQDWLRERDYISEYCTSNTINYDERLDVYLYSFYSFETIVEIEADTLDVRRWYGHLPGSWTFDPPDSAFWWQHGGHYLPDGHLITSTHDSAHPTEIIVREYERDEATRTLRQVFTQGVGDHMWGNEYNQMGEVTRLSNGDTLHNLGTYPRIREGSPDGRIVWDLQFPIDNDLGRSTPVTDLYALVGPRR